MSLQENNSTYTEKELLRSPIVRWGLMLVGIAIGFLTLDILLCRPMMQELESVKRELVTVEKSLRDLVGVKEVAWETSHLLSALQTQKKQLESARAALGELREFRQSVETEAQQTGDAVASLDRIVQLQKRVAGQGESVVAVDKILSEIVKLHERLVSEKQTQEAAVASLNRVLELHKQARETGQ